MLSAGGERRTGTPDFGSLRPRLEAERTDATDGGRGPTLGAGERGGRGAAPLCAVCSGMREGRRRGVSDSRSSEWSRESGSASGSMSRMLLCGLRRAGLRAGLRRGVSSLRTSARAPSSSMLFSSS